MAKSPAPLDWIILVGLAIVWGSSFYLMDRGLVAFTNYEVAALRVTVAALVLMPIALRHLRKIPRKSLVPLMVVGLAGNGIPAFLFTTAQTKIASSLAGMLNSLVPLFALLMGLAFFSAKASWQQIIGVLIGFAGAVSLMLAKGTDGFMDNGIYGLLVVASTICYALSVNVIKTYLKDMPSAVITSVALFWVGPPCAAYLVFSDFGLHLTEHEYGWKSLGFVALLGIFGTALAILIFNDLIKRTSVLFSTSVTYLIPIVAMILGYFVLDEVLNSWHFAGIGVILGGVYLTNRG